MSDIEEIIDGLGVIGLRKYVRTALTIAGSDSGGGAGIEADLKTFSAFGVHGLVAVTSVTAQNTKEVTAIHDIPPEVVRRQIEAVADDIGVDAAKTGMLSNKGIIKAVSKTVKRYGFPLVVDPVMIAKSGAPLLREDAVDALIEHILPLSKLVTPNRYEAEKLSGIKIENLEDARKAAKAIAEGFGAEAVIVKGGHLGLSEAVDVLYHDGRFREYRAPFIEGCTHGTGCSFSAAITANLARGEPLEEALRTAKKFITIGIEYGARIGRGHCPVNQNAWIEIPAERWRVYSRLKTISGKFKTLTPKIAEYLPESGVNFVYALPALYARSKNDIAVWISDGNVEFGASDGSILEIMRYYPELRSALVLKYDRGVIRRAHDRGFIVLEHNRGEKTPDLICRDNLLFVMGKTPEEVLEKMEELLLKTSF